MPVSINGSTGITNVDGSAGTPASKGSTSATAGMFFPAANTVAFSTSSTEAMRIDSSQRVGIGTSTPASKLSFGGQSGATATPLALRFAQDYSNTTVASACKIFLYNSGSTNDIYGIGVGSTSDMQYHSYQGSGNGSHNFYTENTLRMRVDGSGRVTMPYQPFFKAGLTNNGDQTLTNTVLPFNVVPYNVGNYYNSSTYRFTAPVSGNYLFMVECYGTSSAGSATMYVVFRVNGTDIGYARGDTYIGGSAGQVAIAPISNRQVIYLNAGDYVDTLGAAYNASSVFRIYTGLGFFSGVLLG